MWWYPFLNYGNICKICYRIGSWVGITVKASLVGGKTENFMPVYSADGLGFTVVMQAKIRTGNSVYEKSFISYLKLKVNRI